MMCFDVEKIKQNINNNSSLKNIHRLSGIYRQAKEFFDKFSI